MVRMKIVSLEIKKIEIGKFFPKDDRVELNVKFNDGEDKQISKEVKMDDPEDAAGDILVELRKLERNLHKNGDSELVIDNFVNIVVKDEDEVIDTISDFIQKAKSRVDNIKSANVAEGYLDTIRELKSLMVEF